MKEPNMQKIELNKDEIQLLAVIMGKFAPEGVFINGFAKQTQDLSYNIFSKLFNAGFGSGDEIFNLENNGYNDLQNKLQEFGFQIKYSPNIKAQKSNKKCKK